jgi:hypothetical protein
MLSATRPPCASIKTCTPSQDFVPNCCHGVDRLVLRICERPVVARHSGRDGTLITARIVTTIEAPAASADVSFVVSAPDSSKPLSLMAAITSGWTRDPGSMPAEMACGFGGSDAPNVFASTSSDGQWSPETRLATNVRGYCKTAIAMGKDGTIYVALPSAPVSEQPARQFARWRPDVLAAGARQRRPQDAGRVSG